MLTNPHSPGRYRTNGVVVNMLGRFGLDAPDEAKAIAAYLEAHYGQ